MSLTIGTKSEIKNLDRLTHCCLHVGIASPVAGRHCVGPDRNYDMREGWAITLPDFEYPVVFDFERQMVYTYPGIDASETWGAVRMEYTRQGFQQAADIDGVALEDLGVNEHGIREMVLEIPD